jgi:hypothetical protein
MLSFVVGMSWAALSDAPAAMMISSPPPRCHDVLFRPRRFSLSRFVSGRIKTPRV